jgi:hypothetical protein
MVLHLSFHSRLMVLLALLKAHPAIATNKMSCSCPRLMLWYLTFLPQVETVMKYDNDHTSSIGGSISSYNYNHGVHPNNNNFANYLF